MGRITASDKFECLECYYGCKGHEIKIEYSTTSNTLRTYLDGKEWLPCMDNDQMQSLYKVIRKIIGKDDKEDKQISSEKLDAMFPIGYILPFQGTYPNFGKWEIINIPNGFWENVYIKRVG